MKDCTFFDFFLQKHSALMPILFFCMKKSGMRMVCFWRKMSKIKNTLYHRLFFFIFYDFFSINLSLLCPFDLYKKNMTVLCFWRKWPKSKINYLLSMSFFALFWYFSPKTRQCHAHCIFSKKYRHNNIVFWWKMSIIKNVI